MRGCELTQDTTLSHINKFMTDKTKTGDETGVATADCSAFSFYASMNIGTILDSIVTAFGPTLRSSASGSKVLLPFVISRTKYIAVRCSLSVTLPATLPATCAHTNTYRA